MKRLAALACFALCLSGCRTPVGGGAGAEGRQAAAGAHQLQFIVAGSRDNQADIRDRVPGVGGKLRRVVWTSHPPLEARRVTVLYDNDSRPQSWQLEVEGPRQGWPELLGEVKAVTTPQGPGGLVTGGRSDTVWPSTRRAAGGLFLGATQ
ncbi:hypothetical protein ACFP81_01945 [Deinococcus lacus]|uniref:Lipoprotein n=1 Tax=Deinococcus lacus TaxID=392561 RepID=A0ABW1YA93_9DEIO